MEENVQTITPEQPTSAPVTCRRCGTRFAGLQIEQIGNAIQLRSGTYLVQKMEANCTKCGWKFIWSFNDKKLEEVAMLYGRLLDRFDGLDAA